MPTSLFLKTLDEYLRTRTKGRNFWGGRPGPVAKEGKRQSEVRRKVVGLEKHRYAKRIGGLSREPD